MTVGLALAGCLCGCVAGRWRGAGPAATPPLGSHLVAEDARGVIVAMIDLPDRAVDYTRTERSPGGIAIVTQVARGRRALVASRLEQMLSAAGLEEVGLRAALRERRLTCHRSFYADVDGRFAGVGTLDCLDALVYRTIVDDRPLERQVGLIAGGSRGDAGRIAHGTERRGSVGAGLAGSSPGAPGAVGWVEILPILEALVVLERDPTHPESPGMVRVCSGRNHLDRLDAGQRDPLLERALVRGLVRFMKEDDGLALLRGYLDDADFPRRVFQDPIILKRLAPRLAQELRLHGIEPNL